MKTFQRCLHVDVAFSSQFTSLVSKHKPNASPRRQCCASGVVYSRSGSCILGHSRSESTLKPNAEDPGCLSRIPDPTSVAKRGGCCLIFFCSHKIYRTENYLFLNRYRKNLSQLTMSFSTWYSKNCLQALHILVADPGSGKNLFRIQGSKRHGIPDPDSQHC
jgi:hypothetical protein